MARGWPRRGAAFAIAHLGLSSRIWEGRRRRRCRAFPWVNRMRSSRQGRNLDAEHEDDESAPGSALPGLHRRSAPGPRATAAPTACPIVIAARQRVGPRDAMVLWKSAWPFSASIRRREPL